MIDRKALEAERDILIVDTYVAAEWGAAVSGRIERIKEIDALLAAPRPRALHKLDLRPGDVVELMGWDNGSSIAVGKRYTVNADVSQIIHVDGGYRSIPSNNAKGHRPLFTVVSRADVAVSLELATIAERDMWRDRAQSAEARIVALEKVPNLIDREGDMADSGQPSRALWEALHAADCLIHDPDNTVLRAEYEKLIK